MRAEPGWLDGWLRRDRMRQPRTRPGRGVRLARPTTWVVRFGGDRTYTIRFDGEHWSRYQARRRRTSSRDVPRRVRFLAALLAGQVAGKRHTGEDRRACVRVGAGTRSDNMKLGTSLRFFFPTSPATRERFRSNLASMPKESFIERPSPESRRRTAHHSLLRSPIGTSSGNVHRHPRA
jgi:hypothetical protein